MQDALKQAHLFSVLGSLFFVLAGIAILVWPLHAAIQIEYVDIQAIDGRLQLKWRTVVENDLEAIEIYWKEEDASLSAYRLIGTRLAQGSKEEGADYQMDIVQGMEPDTTYCFRLKEVTLDNRKGDILDYCGYGLNVIPILVNDTKIITLSTRATVTITLTLTNTGIQTNTGELTDNIPSTSITTEITSTPTLTSNDSDDIVIKTPSLDAVVATSSPTIIILDEIATPTSTTSALPTVIASQTEQSSVDSGNQSPLPTVSATFTPIPTATEAFTDGTQSSIIDSTITIDAAAAVAPSNLQDSESAGDSEPTLTANVETAPFYIVLTATPAVAPIALAPTFTPFPTAIAVSKADFFAANLPTQNLMLLLLCGVFSGASGLGILGVVTTLLYMRSRTSERR